jgi:hypothetical protein
MQELKPQIGVAGYVPTPGIFTIDGHSSTLGALLRRAGDNLPLARKQARIIRSVDLRAAPGGPDREFYCQRIDLAQASSKVLATPVYSQEVVIVDGPGEKPMYVAVMPHFILQLPAGSDHAITAEQLLEKFAAYWPGVQEQSIGVLKVNTWGVATRVGGMPGGEPAASIHLGGGDVLYVEGLGLDRSQIIALAESIAAAVGAKVRPPGDSTEGHSR